MPVNKKSENFGYWESLLIRKGLGMNRGLVHEIIYAGNSNDLAVIEEQQLKDVEGQLENGGHRVTPKGKGPDA